MASIVTLDRTTSSIDLNVQGLTGSSTSSYTKVNFYCTNTGQTITVTQFYGTSGAIYSGRASFTGLSSGTTYTFSVRVYYQGGDTSLGSVSVTTISADSTPPTISNLTSTVPGHGWVKTTTIDVSANVSDTNSGVYSVNCIFNGTEKTSTSGVNGVYTFSFSTPVTPGSYTVSWSARDKSGNLRSGVSTTYWIGFDNTAPTISATDISSTGSSVRAGVTGNDSLSGVASITFKISPPDSNASFGQAKTYYAETIGASMGQYHNFTVDGNGNSLALGKKYYVEITVTDRLGTYVKQVISVTHSLTKPATWSWQSYETDAFNNRGAITMLTWQRWNAFCDHVLSVTSWYYNSTTDSYNLSQAKMSENSKVLTATRFNIVKNAIGSMVATGISDRKAGDPVLGSYFITLAQKVNAVSK